MKRNLQTLLFSIALLSLSYSSNAQISRLFAVSNTNGNFTVLDTSDYSIINQAPIILTGFTVDSVFGLTQNPVTGDYYAVVAESLGSRLLVTINPFTNVATSIGNLGVRIATLAFSENGTLYGVSDSTEVLYRINTLTATSDSLNQIGEGMLFSEALAYHPGNDNLYYSTLDSINRTILKRIDTLTFDTTTFLVDSNLVNIEALPKAMTWMDNGMFLLETADGFFIIDTLGNAVFEHSRNTYSGIAFYDCPTLAITGVTSYCMGDSTFLTATFTEGTDTYQWFMDGVAITNATDSIYYAKAPGVYNVLYASQFCGQDSLLTGIIVTENPLPAVTITPGNGTICTGDSIKLTGTSGGTNQWYKDGVMIVGADTNICYAKSAGNYNMTKTNTNGCTDSSATGAIITENPKPVVTISGNPGFCPNDSTLLTGTAGGTNQWYRNGAVITGASSNTYYAKTAGVYNMLKTDSNGCKDSAATGITVIANSKPVVTITGSPYFCKNGSTLLTGSATNEATFQWYKNKTIISGATSKTYSATTEGIYNVRITNNNGCADSAAVGLKVIPAFPAFTITGDTAVCPGNGEQALLQGPAGGTNQWYKNGAPISGANLSTYNATTVGVYNMLKTQNGCTDSAAVGITLINACTGIEEESQLKVKIYPNPANDKITLELPQSVNSAYLRMYNSIGQLVIEQSVNHVTNVVLDINNQVNGIYFITLTSDNKIISTSKILVNR